MQRKMYADPRGVFVHDAILKSCRRFAYKTAIVDTSNTVPRRITYAEYGDIVERLARGLVAAGLRPGEIVAIYLPNSWEFAATYHAATLAGGVATLLNPSYREREVRYQIENSGAAMLISDGVLLQGMNLSGLSTLRHAYTTRTNATGAESFDSLLTTASSALPQLDLDPAVSLGALPYSSGTTGLPKGVMLSHHNLIANVYQTLGDPDHPVFGPDEVALGVIPLYHIYGLNVLLNPVLVTGSTLVLAARFDLEHVLHTIMAEGVTVASCVPPMLNAFSIAAERGLFPHEHRLRWVKSGAAPLAPELAHRFTSLTGIRIRQGYGMTEASPVTHIGCLDEGPYKPESIGWPVAQTHCRVVDENDNDVQPGQPGELVMRGPQFMLGYWRAPEATTAVLRDGWYWSGDVVRRDEQGFYYVLDRRKEMIKYKGFAIAPAEIESVLLEHPAVRDCGVVARPDPAAGEVPCGFVVLREGYVESDELRCELTCFVADRLAHHKQPRELHFVDVIPHTPSGKILRRELRRTLTGSASAA